jgi:hypothetical protein
MADVEGVDGSDSSWPDIVQYAESIAEKSKHLSVYCYLRVPHGLELSARKLIFDLGAEDNFSVLHEQESFPATCTRITTLRSPEKAAFWWRAFRSVFPSRLTSPA